MRRQVLERQIHAAAREIVFDVAENVRQLQRDAEVERVFARRGASTAEDLDADEADRRRDPPAVLEQIVERLVSRRVEIHRDAVDDVLERLARQVEPPR